MSRRFRLVTALIVAFTAVAPAAAHEKRPKMHYRTLSKLLHLFSVRTATAKNRG
jgi:hypothetical protein